MMGVQAEYIDDMHRYKKQVEEYNLMDDVRLRGINDVEDTSMRMVHFSFDGSVHRVMVGKDECISTAVRARVKEMKELYNEKETSTSQTE